MQGARCDAVRALQAVSNAAERRLWKSEITKIYWGLLSNKGDACSRPKAAILIILASAFSGNDRHPDPDLCVREQLEVEV